MDASSRTPVRQRRGFVPASPKPQQARLAPRSSRALALVTRLFFFFALLVFVGFISAVLLGAAVYLSIAREIPDPSQLEVRQSTFASTKVFDRHGNLLVEFT
ncbi:MAG: hypothetical protein NZ693_08130, partial [Thermoflexales bacterium]|nr:hypothetical protein [Thermoflexales bacterium]